MKPLRCVFLAASLLAPFAACPAATLVSFLDNAYTAGDVVGNSVAYSATDPNVTASTLTHAITGAGFSTSTGTFFVASSLINTNGGTGGSTTPWMTFSISAQPGYTLDLTSLTFKYGGSLSTGQTAVPTYTPGYTVYYSTDNFATAGTAVGTGNGSISLSSGQMKLTNNAVIDLSSYSGISSAQTVSFRISIYDNVFNANLAYRLDDIVLSGTSVSQIPEPSAYVLVAGALAFGLVLVRRRR